MASHTARRTQSQPAAPEVVDPRWLLKALGIAVASAVILGYLSVCLLVSLGGWQLMLHPVTKVDAVPSVPFDWIRFDAAASGSPRLTAWWIPAGSPARLTPTILFLHDGSGSLSKSARKLDLLHRANVNVFALDYRGFGKSGPPHPNEVRMTEDAEAALDFLVNTRHIPVATIVPYGEGLGAALAASLSERHREVSALVLDTPDPDAWPRISSLGQSRLLPMRLLLHERFDVASPLAVSTKPKLLLVDGPFGDVAEASATDQRLFRSAPDPKLIVTFAHGDSEDAYLSSVHRFLDEYLPR